MYDWIPMEFEFEYLNIDGTYTTYWCKANDETRTSFAVNLTGETRICNDWYEVECLISALEFGSTINGMSMHQLQNAYSFEDGDSKTCQDDEIDISSLI